MTNRTTFTKDGLERLLEKDTDVRNHFLGHDGKLLSRDDPEFQRKVHYLEDSLGKAYDIRFQTYEKSSFRKYATGLRILSGLGAITAGALFWPLAGTAGLYYALGSAAGNLLADSLDARAYAKEGKLTGMQSTGVAAKALPHKLLSWFIPGYGVVDSLRGRARFEYAAGKQALYQAKDAFLEKMYADMGREHKIISLDKFRNQHYARDETLRDRVLAKKAS